MEMTEREICYKVDMNGGDYHFIKILAELNMCSLSRIEDILRNHGYKKVSGSWKKDFDALYEEKKQPEQKEPEKKVKKDIKLKEKEIEKENMTMNSKEKEGSIRVEITPVKQSTYDFTKSTILRQQKEQQFKKKDLRLPVKIWKRDVPEVKSSKEVDEIKSVALKGVDDMKFEKKKVVNVMQKYTDEEKKVLKEKVVSEFLENGSTYKDIAEKFECSEWFVGEAIRAHFSANKEEEKRHQENKNILNKCRNDVLKDRTLKLDEILDEVTPDMVESAYKTVCLQIAEKQQEMDHLKTVRNILEKLYDAVK